MKENIFFEETCKKIMQFITYERKFDVSFNKHFLIKITYTVPEGTGSSIHTGSPIGLEVTV